MRDPPGWGQSTPGRVRGVLAPSGHQYEINHGHQRAVIVEVGGGLRAYEVGGRPVLDGYDLSERASGGRGQPLIPWPTRLRDGRYEFDGQPQELPLTEARTRTAIHGLVRWANWRASEHEPSRLVMTHTLYPQPGWAWPLELAIEYQLDEAGLAVTVSAVNAGDAAAPFGVGFHPYLTAGTPTVDSVRLTVPGAKYLESDERGLPVATHDVAGSQLDFRAPREIGAARLDTCFTDLSRDPDGLARVVLEGQAGTAVLWVDQAFGYLMVFTGDTLSAERRRRGLAVEPMSCPPNALETGADLVRLEPGHQVRARWGIARR
jgi:aldose 1-epimerase